MKNLKVKILIACTFLSMQSCEHILDQAEEERAQDNFTSEFMGNYSGSYTGDMSGPLTVNVRKDGAYRLFVVQRVIQTHMIPI